jgi:hypothetical protein
MANVTGTPNHVIPQPTRPPAPADVLDWFTRLEGMAATGKPPDVDAL